MKLYLKSFLFAVAFFLSIQGFCISIYEISYEFKGLTDYPKYTAFLVRYGNGTGFMRVRYFNNNNSKEVFVVEMEFDEVEGRSKIDGLPHYTLQFKGKTPKYIINTSADKNVNSYNPDVLWFKKRADDKNFKPWGVTSLNTEGTYEQGKIISVKLMNISDLTKSYVKQYFKESESFYVNLFKTDDANVVVNNTKPPVNSNTGNNGVTNTNTTPAKIHFIMVANTEDARIGASVKKDVTNLYSEIKDVSTFLKLPLNYVEISGSNFGKEKVEAAISNLKPGTNDIVIFYYSGHGYSNDQNASLKYPQFDLRQSRFDDIYVATLNVQDVYNKIKAKNARLNIVLADCCNSSLGTLKPEGKSFALTTKSLLSWDRNFCNELFMNSSGSVLATAAKKGQYAYGNTDVGGYFTSNFVTAIEKYLSKFQSTAPTWDKIIAEAQTTTVSLSLSNLCKENTSCRQDPVYSVDVRQ
ncbi:MAG TPA: caspase family protein [Chitinophagaceae bacterium]|nr:caspase family protein [Chitinophagaceae bacterium]HNA92633.1 caspase family protein [Chitinophagaceae bacterium]HND95553.1 caspase family protein [Chitinophagaceae bacterium]HNL58847.1 caspase family protein [Chitinophagaceae bacterium]HNO00237.1 caspase family protein [Chitinophagaceae bacterium]